MMKRVCIVGFGAIGPVHAKALETIHNAELYGICDADPARLQKGLDRYPVKSFRDFAAVLSDPLVDVVHICTPHYLHYEMICQALDAGKSVVSEKPVTMTKAQYLSLLERADANKVCVVLQNRFNPCVVKLKSIITAGELGRIKGIKGMVTWHRDRKYYENDAWRGKWDTEGGGVLINQSIHTLDLLGYLAGNITAVSAAICNHALQDVIEVEDTVSARMTMEDNVVGVFFATNSYMSDSMPFIEVSFEHGLARYMDGRLWINGELAEVDKKPSAGKSYWGTGHQELLRQYYEEDNYISAPEIKNSMLTVFAAYESAADGNKAIEI